jgi:hypothetical protein
MHAFIGARYRPKKEELKHILLRIIDMEIIDLIGGPTTWVTVERWDMNEDDLTVHRLSFDGFVRQEKEWVPVNKKIIAADSGEPIEGDDE